MTPVRPSISANQFGCNDRPRDETGANQGILSQISIQTQFSRLASCPENPISKTRSRLLCRLSSPPVKKHFVGFNDLPLDAQRALASRMGIADLYTARLAGLGLTSKLMKPTSSDDKETKNVLREFFLRKLRALQPLWKCWLNHSHRGLRSKRKSISPLGFVTKVQRLFVPSATQRMLTTLSELPNLLELDLSRENTWRAPPLDGLPDSVAACHRLRVLKMSRSSFRSLPDCVLRLRRLRILAVDCNTQLMVLPSDIGRRLKQLAEVDISGCEKVKELPPSLLETLENSIRISHTQSSVNPKTKKENPPLSLSREYFEDGYLMRVLNARDYPKLVQALDRPNNVAVEQVPEQQV